MGLIVVGESSAWARSPCCASAPQGFCREACASPFPNSRRHSVGQSVSSAPTEQTAEGGTVSITANITHSSGYWQVLGQTPAGGVSGAGPFPAVWMAIFHCMFLWGRGLRYFGGFFSRVSDVIHEVPAFVTQTPKHQPASRYQMPSQEAILSSECKGREYIFILLHS